MFKKSFYITVSIIVIFLLILTCINAYDYSNIQKNNQEYKDTITEKKKSLDDGSNSTKDLEERYKNLKEENKDSIEVYKEWLNKVKTIQDLL